MSIPDECTILTGLLDFYSDRATTHASFVVAATFGIYTLLFSLNNVPIKNNSVMLLIVMSIYIPLAALDIYSFLNFNEYASIAHLIQQDLITKRYKLDVWYKEMSEKLKRSHRMASYFDSIKNNKYFREIKTYFLLPLGIFLTAILPGIFVYLFVWT